MNDLPTGFLMVLAQNEKALLHFTELSDDARRQVISKARQAASREEMQAIADSLI